jgi:hypothetical protein
MIRLLTLLLLLLAIGTGGFLLITPPVSDIELIDYFPENTLIFVEWNHTAQAVGQERLKRSEKTIEPTTWCRFLLQAKGEDALTTEICRLISTSDDFAHHPAVSSLLENGTVFALLPDFAGQSNFSLFRQWMMAVRVNDDVSEQWIEELFGRIRSRQSIEYQGEVVSHLVVDDGQDFFYWRHQNVVLVACEQELIRRSIDQNFQRMIRVTTSLSMNTAYLRLRRLLNKDRADIFCYIDLDGLVRLVPLVQKIETESGGLLPRHIAFSYRGDAGSNWLGISALASQESVSAFIARHRLSPPVRQPTMDLMSQEAELALWTNWFKAKYLWDVASQRAGDDAANLLSLVGQHLSGVTGKSMDDFFDIFGGEFGVMITEQQVERQSPRFFGGLLVAVHDRPAMAAMVEQMMAGLQVVTVKSGNGMEIASILLAGGLLQPAYALMDHHFILADSVTLVELVQRNLMYDGAGDGRTGVPDKMDEQKNVAVFLRVGKMAERLTPLLTLLAEETGEWNRIVSREVRHFIREIGLPLLAGLRNVSTGWLRGYVADDTFFMELEYTPRLD